MWVGPRGVIGLLPPLKAAASLPRGSYFLSDGMGCLALFQKQLRLDFRNRLLGVGRQGRWIFGVLFPFQLSEAVESVQDGTSHALGDLVLPRPVPGDFLTLHLLGLSLPSLLVQAECCTRASRILPVLQVHGLRSIGEQLWAFLCRNFLRRKAIHHLNNSFQIDRNDSLMIPFRTFDHRSKIVISEGKGFKPENAR